MLEHDYDVSAQTLLGLIQIELSQNRLLNFTHTFDRSSRRCRGVAAGMGFDVPPSAQTLVLRRVNQQCAGDGVLFNELYCNMSTAHVLVFVHVYIV